MALACRLQLASPKSLHTSMHIHALEIVAGVSNAVATHTYANYEQDNNTALVITPRKRLHIQAIEQEVRWAGIIRSKNLRLLPL